MPPATDDVSAALDALREEVECCTRCVLHETRTRAVFGEGDAGADLMFVGEAPGYHEDQQGRPFVGQAGKLLEQLLASIGLTREQVYIANVLKSRPPNNRDPRPEEIDACQPYLWRQIEIIKPKVVCTLGNFATKLLSGDQTGITRVHGTPRAVEISGHPLYLYPIFHPAAALYTPAMLTTLKEDFSRLPDLIAHAAPEPGEEAAAPTAAERPAWRPPERLRPDLPAPSGAAAPTLEDAAAVGGTSTLEGAATVDEAPAPDTVSLRADASAPEPVVEPAPEPVVEPAPPPGADPAPPPGADPAPPPGADPAPEPADDPSPRPVPTAGPPAEPEQLGLF